jgi:hypothetical protein
VYSSVRGPFFAVGSVAKKHLSCTDTLTIQNSAEFLTNRRVSVTRMTIMRYLNEA